MFNSTSPILKMSKPLPSVKSLPNLIHKPVETLPSSGKKDPKDFVLLNVGGTSFSLAISTIRKRGNIGLLYKFASMPHESRLELCDNFKPATGYFFERSSLMFQAIYLYYLNGLRMKVPLFARDQFIQELSFWGLAKLFYPNLIDRRLEQETRELTIAEKFRCVCLGELRERVWHFCETPESSKAARIFGFCSVFAVLVSNLALIIGSMERFQVGSEPHAAFEYIEYVCIALFTSEFAMKALACPDRPGFFYNYMNLVDFLAIAPFYLELALTSLGFQLASLKDVQASLLVMRVLRVMRVVRLLKLGRHCKGLAVFIEVIWSTCIQLGVVMAVVGIGIVFFSTIVYYLEKDEEGGQFESIPMTIWWSVVTVSTVGYGDMVPTTAGGKLVATFAIAMGVLVLSMPITIFVDRFINVNQESEIERARDIDYSRLTPRNGVV